MSVNKALRSVLKRSLQSNVILNSNGRRRILRRQGLRVIVFLDDYLLVHQNRTIKNFHVLIAMTFLKNLRWTINLEKSICTPTRSIDLGITWDTLPNAKSLPAEKEIRIRQCLITRLSAGNCTLKEAQRLLEYLNFATFITHWGRLHGRTLQRHSNALRRSPLSPSPLAEEVNQDMVWWLHNLSHKTVTRPIHIETRHVNYIVIAASDL
ncbi:unnamed protein product [Pieris brassicae]|uniref:Reverse transcriptase domain-containing protein n=1 Tax=Pieris brassicae TaxID=7116 RepID=A0A9P0TBW3_PIEBR|nr:unnamed protein product [Pieris brassicae]